MESISQNEPRSESLPTNPDDKLAQYEQKLSDLENRRLQDLDRAILLQQQVDSLQIKLSSVQKEKEESLVLAESRRAEVDDLSSRLGFLENSALAKDEIIKDLVKEKKVLEDMQGDQNLEAKMKDLEERNEKLLKEKESLKAKFENISRRFEDSEQQRESVSQKVKLLEKDKQSLTERMSKLEQMNEASDSMKAALEAKIFGTEERLTEMTHKYESISKSLSESESKCQTLSNEMSQIQSTFTAEKNLLESQLEESKAEILKQTSLLLSQKQSFETQISTLQDSLTASEVRYKTLREEVLQSRDNSEKLKHQYEVEKDTLKNDMLATESLVQSLKESHQAMIKEYEDKIKGLNNDIENLNNEKNELGTAFAKLKASVDLAKEEMKQTMLNGKGFESEIAKLREINDQAVEERAQIVKEFEGKLAAVQTDKSSLEQKNEELNSKLSTLAKRFLDGGNEKQVAMDRITDLERKLTSLRQAKKEAEEKVEVLQAKVSQAPAADQIKADQAKIKSLERQLRESRESVIKKKFEIKVMTGLFVSAVVALVGCALYFLVE